jgi:F0F1-type ATP synthase membrane subunit b/b'
MKIKGMLAVIFMLSMLLASSVIAESEDSIERAVDDIELLEDEVLEELDELEGLEDTDRKLHDELEELEDNLRDDLGEIDRELNDELENINEDLREELEDVEQVLRDELEDLDVAKREELEDLLGEVINAAPLDDELLDDSITLNEREVNQLQDDAKMCAIELGRKDDLIMGLDARVTELIEFLEAQGLEVPDESDEVRALIDTSEFDELVDADAMDLVENAEVEVEKSEPTNLLQRFFGFFSPRSNGADAGELEPLEELDPMEDLEPLEELAPLDDSIANEPLEPIAVEE